MSTGLKIGLVVAALVGIFGIGSCVMVVGLNNDLVAQEQGIKAQHGQNRNNYDNMWKTFKEVSQVPEMYIEDMKKVWDSAIQGRYGEDGSKAMFQFIQEQNPQVDSGMYKNIQAAIQSGRASFQADQKMLLDKKRVYETKLGQFPANFVASLLGFPKIDLSQYDIVTSDKTEEAFKTKKAEEIQLRPRKAEQDTQE